MASADQSHFVRAFRRFTGMPPTRWEPERHELDAAMGLGMTPRPELAVSF